MNIQTQLQLKRTDFFSADVRSKVNGLLSELIFLFGAVVLSFLFSHYEVQLLLYQAPSVYADYSYLFFAGVLAFGSLIWGRIIDLYDDIITLGISFPCLFMGLTVLFFELSIHVYLFGMFLIIFGISSFLPFYIRRLAFSYSKDVFLSSFAKKMALLSVVVYVTIFSAKADIFMEYYHPTFLAFASITFILFIFSSLYLKENLSKAYFEPHTNFVVPIKEVIDLHKPFFPLVRSILVNPMIFSYMFMMAFPLSGILCFFMISPYILSENKYIYEEYILISGFVCFFFSVSSLITSYFHQKFSPDVLIRAGNLLIVLASFLFINIVAKSYFSHFAFTFPLLIWAYSMGMSYATSLTVAISYTQRSTGLLIGLTTVAQYLLTIFYYSFVIVFHQDYRFTLAATLILIAMHGSWIYYSMVVSRLKP